MKCNLFQCSFVYLLFFLSFFFGLSAHMQDDGEFMWGCQCQHDKMPREDTRRFLEY